MRKKKTEYGCEVCGRKPKKIPYGGKRNLMYCSFCDRGASTGVSKKAERQSAKRRIMDDPEYNDYVDATGDDYRNEDIDPLND